MAAASSGAHEPGIEGKANKATAINEPNEKSAPADEFISPSATGPSQFIAGNAEWSSAVFRSDDFSNLLDERELGDLLTLERNAQNNFGAAAVSSIYGAEVDSTLFELQAHYQLPNTGAVTTPPGSKEDVLMDEPIQGAVSESENAGIHLTPAQAEDYNRASVDANNTRNPFDTDDEVDDEDEANAIISQAGADGMQKWVLQQGSIEPAFLAEPASTLIVDPSPPAMTAASAAPTGPEKKVINLSPEQLQEYNQVSSAAFNVRNPFDSDDEDDEPLPSTVGSTVKKTSAESQSTPAQTPPMATHASQMVPAPAPAPLPALAPAAAPVNCRIIFPETDPLPLLAAAPAPTWTWHNTAPAPIAAVAAPIIKSYNNGNVSPPDAAFYSPDDSPCMIWEHSNPEPMDWDTATSFHLSNPPGRIITSGGFDIEMGTLTEFREVKEANTRLNKKGRRRRQQQQQQVLLNCRARLKKKESVVIAEGTEGGRKKVVCKKSGRGKRQGGEGRRREEAEDSLMTFPRN